MQPLHLHKIPHGLCRLELVLGFTFFTASFLAVLSLTPQLHVHVDGIGDVLNRASGSEIMDNLVAE